MKKSELYKKIILIIFLLIVLCSCNKKANSTEIDWFLYDKVPSNLDGISYKDIKKLTMNSQIDDIPKEVSINSQEDIQEIINIIKSLRYKEVNEEVQNGWLITIEIKKYNGDNIYLYINNSRISGFGRCYDVNTDITEQLQVIYNKTLDRSLYDKVPSNLDGISYKDVKKLTMNSQIDDIPKEVIINSQEDIQEIVNILKSVCYKDLSEEVEKGWQIIIEIEKHNGDNVYLEITKKRIFGCGGYYEVSADITQQLQAIYKKNK